MPRHAPAAPRPCPAPAPGDRRRGRSLAALLLLLTLPSCTPTPATSDSDSDTASTSGSESGDSSGATSEGGETGDALGPLCDPMDISSCGDDKRCCSDDPTALGGGLPQYPNASYVGAPPIFSDNNNVLSRSGQCVTPVEDTTLGLPCPIPCNPRWSPNDVATVCGLGGCCRQTREVVPELDCVLDPDTNRYRAVQGTDIGQVMTRPDSSQIVINWAPGTHATHQDPNGTGCQTFTGDPDPGSSANLECYALLTVADQRGYCDTACPCVEDLCDQFNPDYVPKCL